ncbi:hypothetical protein HPY32_08200 [Nocardia terpenica]|nr:hypothetical protein [Nocardia terpenica]
MAVLCSLVRGDSVPERRVPDSLRRGLVRLAGALSAAAVSAVVAAGPASAAPPDPAAAIASTDRAAGAGDLGAAYQTAIEGLQRLGIQPFLYPTGAAFCHEATTLGMVPALAGAVPGPWPKTTVAVPGLDVSAVKAGQTMFAFVPYGLGPDGPDTSGMRVAWLNTTTGRGGLASMGPLSEVVKAMVPPEVPASARPLAEQVVQTFFATALPMGGVRAVPVTTGSGTVLAAVFGSVRNGARTCYFLPTVGITTVA